jgi:phenylalanyl-tRNA synthetase beta chain
VALVVDAATPAGEVHRRSSTGPGAAGVGAAVRRLHRDAAGAGRKSLAYKLTFRAPDRTLTVEEAVAARDAAVALAAQRPVR